MEAAVLMDYHDWASERLLGLMEALTDEQYTRDMGSSFPSVQATVAHMINAEGVWLERITGAPRARVAPADVPSVGAARERWAGLRRDLREWAAGLGDPVADRSVRMVTSKGQEFSHTFEEIALHLMVHGSYHRGQVVTMLRQLGAPAVSLDLITFFRERNA